jgi:hypothetical protein
MPTQDRATTVHSYGKLCLDFVIRVTFRSLVNRGKGDRSRRCSRSTIAVAPAGSHMPHRSARHRLVKTGDGFSRQRSHVSLP